MKHAEENIDWSLGMRPLESHAIASLLLRRAAWRWLSGLVVCLLVRWL